MKYRLYLLPFTLLCMVSCMSVPKDSDVPYDSTPSDLKQKAQEAFDARNYKASRAYYEILLRRFGTDEAIAVTAEYEIAHLYVKRRKWKQAYEMLDRIIEKYGSPAGIHLPPQYYKLAKIDYERTKAKLKIKDIK